MKGDFFADPTHKIMPNFTAISHPPAKPLSLTDSPILPSHPHSPTFTQQTLVTYHNASMGYGQDTLWQNVNFAIQSGEFVALLGANGVGKTTLFKALLGVLPLKSGNIALMPNLKLGYVPQLKEFDPKIPIRGRDLVALGLDGKDYGVGILGNFFTRLNKNHLSTKQKNALIDNAIHEVGGQAFANARLDNLSGGEQQRMRIAQALVSEPELLLMDEPLLSLDVKNQQIVAEILAHRKQYHHTAVFMITHEILPVLPLMDKVILLKNQQAKIGTPAEIMPDGRLYLL